MQGVLHKTLIIRLSSVGDVVLSSPLVRCLRGRFPDSQIDFLVKSTYADLVRHNPHLSHVLEFPDDAPFTDLLRLRAKIASTGYDLIIDIHDSLRSRLLSIGSRHVTRVNKRKLARTLLVKFKLDVYDRYGGAPGVAQRYLNTVRSFGVEDDGKGLDLFVPADVTTTVRVVLAGEGITTATRCIGVCPSAKHANKIWPEDRFAEAAGRLAAPGGSTVLLFGSTDDRERCASIGNTISTSHRGTHVVNLAGRMSLLETAAALDMCSLVLTNDSGLMHIAAARKREVVAVFGPTVRQFGFFPPPERSTVVERSGLECRPCTHIGLPYCPQGHFRCMKDITVESVVSAAGGGAH
jgi:heptosyltransferase-2